jgi:hypothetical protein
MRELRAAATDGRCGARLPHQRDETGDASVVGQGGCRTQQLRFTVIVVQDREPESHFGWPFTPAGVVVGQRRPQRRQRDECADQGERRSASD